MSLTNGKTLTSATSGVIITSSHSIQEFTRMQNAGTLNYISSSVAIPEPSPRNHAPLVLCDNIPAAYRGLLLCTSPLAASTEVAIVTPPVFNHRRRWSAGSSLRTRVYAKSDGYCAYCGTPLDHTWEIDHMTPGNSRADVDNLIACCGTCNRIKSNRTVAEFREFINSRPHKYPQYSEHFHFEQTPSLEARQC